MRRPEGTCHACWQPHPDDQMCWPAKADARTYGDPADGWSASTDRLESFILDISNPRIDTHRGAPGFVVDAAKVLTERLRAGFASGELTAADLAPPAAPAVPVEQAGRRELDELRKLSDAATPGVWLADGTSVAADSDERRFLVVADRVKTSPWNASFIAAAVNHVRSLLAAAPSPATEPVRPPCNKVGHAVCPFQSACIDPCPEPPPPAAPAVSPEPERSEP